MTGPFQRDAEIFAEALRRPPAERAVYLTGVCGSDEALRRRLEDLLQVQERVGDFLEQTGEATGGVRDRVGRYRLIEKIGEGGCGVVYLAEQETPVRRQVALKIIKPGMDTREVIARFEAERQALALMDHPGIAKVFDAGETDSGRPYFVMELIRGTKITDYCDQHSLTTDERLGLFIQVCQAIQHAHQKGIIHRDIKPSNILVTTTAEGAPQPVVIDFGIAKATASVRLTDRTLFTALNMLVGTPTYMSPEQTAVAGVDVDTRSDIYSLGVLLYELLTGTTPFDAGELLQLGLDEVRRAIREREPLRPSARLSRMIGRDLSTAAGRRRAEPPGLIRAVRGDLDCIVMKALEKDRARRYETATGLATDVGRFLDDEPISARPASAWYRLRKTAARNRVLFGGLAAVGALMAGSLVVIAGSLAKERHAHEEAEAARQQADTARKQAESERATAQSETAKSQQVTRFLQDLLLAASPEVAQGRDNAVLRELLEKAAERIPKELADQPMVVADLQQRIGKAYVDMHLWPEAEKQFRLALEIYRKEPGRSDRVAAGLHSLFFVLHSRNQMKDAKAAAEEALAIRRQPPAADSSSHAVSIHDLAEVEWALGNRSKAESLYREALAMRRRVLREDDPAITESLYALATMLDRSQVTQSEAEALQREVLARAIKAGGPMGPNVVPSYQVHARSLRRMGRLAEAEEEGRTAVEIGKKLHGADNQTVAHSLTQLGQTLIIRGKLDEARAAYAGALDVRPKLQDTRLAFVIIDALFGLSQVAELRGDLIEAERYGREYLKTTRDMHLKEHVNTATALGRLVSILTAAKKFDEIDALFADYLPPGFQAKLASRSFSKTRALHFAQVGRWAEAEVDARSAAKYLPEEYEAQYFHTLLLLATGRTEEHRAQCQNLLRLAGGTSNPVLAVRAAMQCLVQPGAVADLAPVERLAEIGVNGRMEDGWASFAECVRALSEFRAGRFNPAIEWANKSAGSRRADLRVISQAVLAMSHLQRNEPVEARACLAKAAAIARADLPAADSGDLGPEFLEWMHFLPRGGWPSWVLAQTVLAEATTAVAPAKPEGRP